MTQQDKKIGENLWNAFKALPNEKKEYLLGFAEGVAAMIESKQEG